MLTEDNFERILDQKNAANTYKGIRTSINIFNEYFRAKNCELNEITKLNQAETPWLLRHSRFSTLMFGTRQTMEISGHKSESSVRSYIKRLGKKKQREIFNNWKSETEPPSEHPHKSPSLSVQAKTIHSKWCSHARNSGNVLENIENIENNYLSTDVLPQFF